MSLIKIFIIHFNDSSIYNYIEFRYINELLMLVEATSKKLIYNILFYIIY